jgi:AraC-like DNA-binding protein
MPLSNMFAGNACVGKKCIVYVVAIEHTKVVYLAKLLEVLLELGCDTRPVIAEIGLPIAALTDHDASMPLGDYLAAIEKATALYDIPDLGFIVGEHTKPLEHGVLGYALLSSPTLRDSLERYVRFQDLQGPLLRINLKELGSTAEMAATPRRGRWRIGPAAHRYIVQEWLVGWNQWCQLIGRGGSFFEHVRLGYAADGAQRHYEDHLGCTVSFNNTSTTAIFAARRLDLPLSYADEAISALCNVQCERLLEVLKLRAGLVADIHRLLANRPGQIPAINEMAENLNMSQRTLRRRLKMENTTYQDIVGEFRVAMAKRYLAETEMPANEIAVLVGYSDPGNLYRAFRRDLGQTPMEYRSRLAS